MRTYLLTAPRWILGLGTGLLFGGLFGFFGWVFGAMSGPEPVIAGVVCGLLFGGSMVIMRERQQRQLRTAAGELPPDQLRAADRAASRGAVPTDPQVRAAAARVAQSRLDSMLRLRVIVIVGIVLLIASTVLNAIDGEIWSTIITCLGVLTMANLLYEIKRLRRRVGELSTYTQVP